MSTRSIPFQIVVSIILLASAARCARAAEPQLQVVRVPNDGIYPQSQVDAQGRLHLIYFKGDAMHGDIFYVRSDDGGATFSPPIRVNSQAESAVVIGTVRGPHLALGKNDRPHVAWMGSQGAEPKAQGKSIPMLYARLNDAGDAFEPQRNVIQQHPGLDGGGAVAADGDGNVYVAWHAPEHDAGPVHGQAQAHHDGATHHVRPEGAGRGEEDRQVWVARSRDDGKTFEPEIAAIPKKTGVCACCGLNITTTGNGQVFIVFRSAHESVNRDIHVLASKDFGKTFEIAAVDPWTVGTCVMSTASFAQRGQEALAVWETKEQVRLAKLGDEHMEPRSIPGQAAARKHPSVAINERGEYAVAWTEGTGWSKGGTVVWQVFDAKGQPIPEQEGRMDGLQAWSVPSVVARKNGSFVVLY